MIFSQSDFLSITDGIVTLAPSVPLAIPSADSPSPPLIPAILQMIAAIAPACCALYTFLLNWQIPLSIMAIFPLISAPFTRLLHPSNGLLPPSLTSTILPVTGVSLISGITLPNPAVPYSTNPLIDSGSSTDTAPPRLSHKYICILPLNPSTGVLKFALFILVGFPLASLSVPASCEVIPSNA